jgi:hypothetical protein
MTNGNISVPLSSTSLTYVVRHTISFCLRQPFGKQADVTWCLNGLVYRQLTATFIVVTTILFAHKPFLHHILSDKFHTHCWAVLDTLILTTGLAVYLLWNGANSGCDRSTGDAYSSTPHDPTLDTFRGLCTPIKWFVFPIGLMRLITVRYFFSFHTHHKYMKLAYYLLNKESWR